MGASPQDSVVNQYGQSWGVKNLFITDGSVFASSPHKNPTLSILALAMRSCTHLAEEMRNAGLVPRMELANLATVPAPADIADHLTISSSSRRS